MRVTEPPNIIGAFKKRGLISNYSLQKRRHVASKVWQPDPILGMLYGLIFALREWLNA
jgi:hypothetical protein